MAQPELSEPQGFRGLPAQPEMSEPQGFRALPAQPELSEPRGLRALPAQPELSEPPGPQGVEPPEMSEPQGLRALPAQPELSEPPEGSQASGRCRRNRSRPPGVRSHRSCRSHRASGGVAGATGAVGATGPRGRPVCRAPARPPPPRGPGRFLQVALLKWAPNSGLSFPVGTYAYGVAFDGANIWVANNGSNNVTKLRASDGALQGTFQRWNRSIRRRL